MSALERVKTFLIKLVKDQDFREELINRSPEELSKFLQEKNYNFSQQEFETAAIEILDLKEKGELNELSEEELELAFGGYVAQSPPEFQAMYGAIRDTTPMPIDWWHPIIKYPPISKRPKRPKPIDGTIRPLYGVVINPNGIQQ